MKFPSGSRVCFVMADYYATIAPNAKASDAGGAEIQLSFIARGLRDAGVRVTVVTYAEGQANEFELDGIRIIKIVRTGRELPFIRNIHPRLTSVWDALSRANADVYWQRCAAAITSVTALFCRVHHLPFIYSGASDADFNPKLCRQVFLARGRGGWRDMHMYQWGLRRATAIVAQHAGQVACCQRWLGREATEIPNCYILPEGAKASPSGVVLWVARMRSLKRPELFLELARDLPHLHFRIVGGPGPGKEASVFERIKAESEALPNIEFVGFVPFEEVESHFNEASLFVNTSDYEGFPNTFLQSWARGIPTVSFFDCGAREEGRPLGYVCKDMSEMKQAISRLAGDKELWSLESCRVRQYFQSHHTVDIAVDRYGRLIGRLIEQERPT